jgi:hypothetical protein
MNCSGEALGQPNLAVNPPQQEGTKVRRPRSTFEISPHRVPGDGRKTQLFWTKIGHKQTSCGFSGMVVSHLPFYQRLPRGLSDFMKNSG